jgi:sigma-B regulation protein RsbU (phosphoserine phosphatase)
MTKRTVLYVALASLFVVAAAYQFRYVQRRIEYLTSPGTFALNQISTSALGRVTSVTKTAEAAGIRVGDELLAVEGRFFTGRGVLDDAMVGKHLGDPLTVTIRRANDRASEQESITFLIGHEKGDSDDLPTVGQWIFVIFVTMLIPIFCLLVGFSVAALRPRDPLAWLLLGLMLSFAQMPTAFDPLAWKGVLRDAAIVYHAGSRTLWSVFMFLFGIYFPERIKQDRRWPWAKWILIVPLTLVAVAVVVSDIGEDRSPVSVQSLNNLLARSDLVVAILQMIATGLFFTFIGMKMGAATSPDARRRLRMLLFGGQISLTPIFILVVIGLLRREPPLSEVPWWLILPALLLLFLFPLTLAHVIVVQRAMDVSVVIRQGVRYAFARGGVMTLRFLIIGVIIFLMIGAIKKPATNPLEISLIVFVGFTSMFAIGHLGERLIKWTDRRFFREAVNAEQVLSDLSDNVRTMVESKPLIETVTRTISDSLHVPRVAFLLKEDGAYKPAYSMGYPDPPSTTFPADAQTVERLREKKEPMRVYLDDRDGWVEKTATGNERDLLERLNTELLLPLGVKNELSGFISLGAKQSEAPYSPTDLKLLQQVATQTGLALENSQLTAAVASEVAQRETLNREVEIAREVQERLFPQNLPQVEGLDYCGACRPALGVGGDYYDFLLLPNGVLGIAIGDVSGKGIAAALLMASLQASLRGQAIRGTSDLADMISNVNRLVYDASASNRYATFFYAQYEPGSRRLTYVNAGHNPPMILRKQGGEWQIIKLEDGGAVVGLLPNFPYTQATVALEKGDMLLAFTDGISEAMNPEDEEWGEENLIETAKEYDGLTAADTITRIVEAADRFANGAKQHDDMTLMVVRLV